MENTKTVVRVLPALALALALTPVRSSGGELDAAALFTTKCTSCHTFGKGARVGPDLKGVTGRHARGWLVSWIQSSEKMIRSGDPTATALYERYRRQRMPDHELTRPQIEALLDYLAAAGPEADQRNQVRPASTATAAEVNAGEKLFYGKMRLASGGVACASCHAVAKQKAMGGSLAPDLGKVYAKYRDRGFSQVLERPCFPRTPSIAGAKVVTADESLALRAFLRAATVGEAR